jgi:hypothetical protein
MLEFSQRRGLEDEVPLSEEELRLLEQMERALVEEDPKFASTLRGTTLRHVARRRAFMAGAGFVVGVVVMMAGAIAQLVVVGIVGFLIMLVCATLCLGALRSQRHSAAAHPEPAAAAAGEHGLTVIQGGRTRRPRRTRRRSSGSFMERLEERWRRRREGNNGW